MVLDLEKPAGRVEERCTDDLALNNVVGEAVDLVVETLLDLGVDKREAVMTKPFFIVVAFVVSSVTKGTTGKSRK